MVTKHGPGADERPGGSRAIAGTLVLDTPIRLTIYGIFILMSAGALYFARDFLLPVSLAFLAALVLSPVVRSLRRRGVPEPLSATALVVALLAVLASGGYSLSGPVSEWVGDAPRIAGEIRSKLAVLRQPVEAVADAGSEVEELTESDDPTVQKVVLSEPGLVTRAATGVPEIAAKTGLSLVLLLFLLASGDMFYEKLVRALPTLSDKKRGLRIARTVEREVSRYLFTVTVINLSLGAAIALAMWAIGMPNPLLWGLAGAFLNFIPYVGAILGMALVAAAALVSFDTIGQALVAPALYFALTSIEGHFVTPVLVGRRLELNTVAVFLAVAFWGWLWGIVGALIAVPMLVTVKVFSDHVEGLHALGEFLSARHVEPELEDEATTAPSSP